MIILISGGAGFIGSHLLDLHLAQGDDVYVIDNLITGSLDNIRHHKENSKLHFVNADVTQYSFEDIPPCDIIYHLASPASPIQYKKYPLETLLANSQGTFRILEFMNRSQSKTFVYTSTSEIYGDPLVHPQKEDYWGNVNTVGPRSCYDEGKRYGETLCYTFWKTYGLDIRIARLFNTYGPRMEKNDGRVVSNFIVQALEKQDITIYGNGAQTRSFCYVSDTVDGLYKLAFVPHLAGEVVNLGNPDERTVMELAEIIKKKTETQSEIVFKSVDADDPKKRKPDISKAIEKLDWQPRVALDEGLDKTIEYFRSILI